LVAYDGEHYLVDEAVPEALRRKLERLLEYVTDAVAGLTPVVELDSRTIRAPRPMVQSYTVRRGPVVSLHYAVVPGGRLVYVERNADALTEAAKRLIENMLPTYEQLAWDELRRQLRLPEVRATRKKVLISYRKTRREYQQFAEAIGHRLGREGFLPWLDEWEVVAGDSLPRELGEGFKDVYGVIIVLTADYPGGKWAREELETAIAKRVEQGIKVIPVKYEEGDPPEMLRPLAYVDCTDHGEDQIELQFREIIDALNEIELNPYRR
jgi:TIR domain